MNCAGDPAGSRRLAVCPDCGRDVSRQARFCVHCGRPWPARRPMAVVIGIIVGLTVGALVALGALKSASCQSRSKGDCTFIKAAPQAK